MSEKQYLAVIDRIEKAEIAFANSVELETFVFAAMVMAAVNVVLP